MDKVTLYRSEKQVWVFLVDFVKGNIHTVYECLELPGYYFLDGIVWMDAMHYKVPSEGKVSHQALYYILGIHAAGMKEVLGMYVSESTGANFWLQRLYGEINSTVMSNLNLRSK